MVALKTVREIALERAEECCRVIGARFLPAVRIIYGSGPDLKPTAIGTCFFLEVDNIRFLVTAAHVIDNNKYISLYVGDVGGLIPVEGEFRVTQAPEGNRRLDHYDFAFWKMSAGMLGRLTDAGFISDQELSHNRGTMDGRQFLAMGYPVSLNQYIDEERLKVPAKAWTYQGSHFPNDALAEKLKVSGHDHFFIRFDDFSGNYSGDVYASTQPVGISGGVLIDLGLPRPDQLAADAPCTGRLAGIGIEHQAAHKALVYVKIGLVVDKIREASMG
jgi:hypothetical protein